MAKKSNEKYWETEKGETVEFGHYFMRCFDKAGKLQFGVKIRDQKTGEWVYAVKFVVDRKELFSSDEAPGFLRGTINDWEELLEEERDADD